VMMPRLQSDLLDLLHATATGALAGKTTEWTPEAALTTVIAAKGYPGEYARGTVIGALPVETPQLVVFHAGTKRENGQLLANGGRVLNVTTLGATVAEAKERADAAIAEIDWPDGFHRHDIGWRAIQRERNARLDG
jgi:phosphoribosylamine--glycine ligase